MDQLRQSDLTRGFFNDFATNWDSLYGGQRNLFWRWFDRKYRKDIFDRYELTFGALGRDLREKTILDVGCGNGVYAFEAVRRGSARVVGVDIAGEMVAICSRRSRELGLEDRTTFICSEFPPSSVIPDLEKEYDIAIAMGVMDYTSDAVGFLSALRKRVSEFAVVSFPGKQWLRWQLRRYRYRLLGRCPVFHYNEADVRACCEKAGFRNVEIKYLPHSGGCYFLKAFP
jgi:2-polyprenyl-3-methyl-5-hydroxy-6-metoxy-1,4-benzoquinol methylase